MRVELNIAPITSVDRAVHVKNRRNQSVLINALGVPEDVGFGFFDQPGRKQSQGLRRAIANPGPVVVPRAGLEGESRRVHKDERRLRLDGVADFAVTHRDLARADLFPPFPDHGLANDAEIPVRARRNSVSHRR